MMLKAKSRIARYERPNGLRCDVSMARCESVMNWTRDSFAKKLKPGKFLPEFLRCSLQQLFTQHQVHFYQ